MGGLNTKKLEGLLQTFSRFEEPSSLHSSDVSRAHEYVSHLCEGHGQGWALETLVQVELTHIDNHTA